MILDPNVIGPFLEQARVALQVDVDGICPLCLTGTFGPSMAGLGPRVVYRVRVCPTCGTVLRHGDVPDIARPFHPRVVN
ncbi:MAG: hypothetical protein EPN53_01025 [Acidobacteria bacterium]|nr:MAG: hypothetical protein EPN53_01025 [Acidobacteriota bacterium]